MSMHKFANAGPIMAGLAVQAYPALVEGNRRIAAMVEIDPPIESMLDMPTAMVKPEPMPSFSDYDMYRMIENIADQLSEVAAQLVEVRQRLDALEKPKPLTVEDYYNRNLAPAPSANMRTWQQYEEIYRQQAQQHVTFQGHQEYANYVGTAPAERNSPK
jgi:hypothetical protein